MSDNDTMSKARALCNASADEVVGMCAKAGFTYEQVIAIQAMIALSQRKSDEALLAIIMEEKEK